MLIFNTTGSQPVSGGSKPYPADLAEFIVYNHYFYQDLSHLTVIISILDYLFIFISLKHNFDVWDLHNEGHLMNLVYKISFTKAVKNSIQTTVYITSVFFTYSNFVVRLPLRYLNFKNTVCFFLLMAILFHLVPIIICLCCILYLGIVSRVSGVCVLEGFKKLSRFFSLQLQWMKKCWSVVELQNFPLVSLE